MATVKGRPTKPIALHRLLRDVYRNYLTYKDYVAGYGNHVIEHGYYVYADDGVTVVGKELVTISFWDLYEGVKELAPRKKEAFFYNVIMDKKQKEVAAIMGITTVSVGQYVEQAMIQLAERYFAEQKSSEETHEVADGQVSGNTVDPQPVPKVAKLRTVASEER